jgi:hypothetical protein
MSDQATWWEVARLLIVAAVSGLGGTTLGAFLTARRERATFKREIYGKILLRLAELHDATGELLRLKEERDPSAAMMNRLTSGASSRAAAAMRDLRSDSALAIVLNPGVAKAIDELIREWNGARSEDTSHGAADRRAAAVTLARRTVSEIAKREL